MRSQPIIDKDGSQRWDYLIATEPWEDDERIITWGGAPIGPTLSRADAVAVLRWLVGGGAQGIRKRISPDHKD